MTLLAPAPPGELPLLPLRAPPPWERPPPAPSSPEEQAAAVQATSAKRRMSAFTGGCIGAAGVLALGTAAAVGYYAWRHHIEAKRKAASATSKTQGATFADEPR